MTYDEFKERTQKLFEEFNRANNNQYDIFVFTSNIKTAKASSFGFGCQKCLAESITMNLDRFLHSGTEGRIH